MPLVDTTVTFLLAPAAVRQVHQLSVCEIRLCGGQGRGLAGSLDLAFIFSALVTNSGCEGGHDRIRLAISIYPRNSLLELGEPGYIYELKI